MRSSLTILGLLAVLTVPAVGAAQQTNDDRARTLFEGGRVSYELGQYELALDQFQESYRLSGRSVLFYNIGQTLDRLRRDGEALEAFEAFVEANPDHDGAIAARERIEFLRARIESGDGSGGGGDAGSGGSGGGGDGGSGGDDVAGAWWLWTIIAVVAVGAGVGIGLGVGLSDQRELPLAGSSAVVFSL